jgi:hypothetical protein
LTGYTLLRHAFVCLVAETAEIIERDEPGDVMRRATDAALANAEQGIRRYLIQALREVRSC